MQFHIDGHHAFLLTTGFLHSPTHHVFFCLSINKAYFHETCIFFPTYYAFCTSTCVFLNETCIMFSRCNRHFAIQCAFSNKMCKNDSSMQYVFSNVSWISHRNKHFSAKCAFFFWQRSKLFAVLCAFFIEICIFCIETCIFFSETGTSLDASRLPRVFRESAVDALFKWSMLRCLNTILVATRW